MRALDRKLWPTNKVVTKDANRVAPVGRTEEECTGVVEIGYALSSEEHPAQDLVRHARTAEETGWCVLGQGDLELIASSAG